jgi:hypothetical protein
MYTGNVTGTTGGMIGFEFHSIDVYVYKMSDN